MNEKHWCPACGKWSDHRSAQCLFVPSAQAPVESQRASQLVGSDAVVGARVESGFFRKFQKGDSVFHRPTGETWYLIDDEKDGWVTPGGWPPSQGRAEDCKLVERGRQAEAESVRQPSPNDADEPTRKSGGKAL